MLTGSMDKKKRKYFRKLGKELVEKRSQELKTLLSQTNEAPFASDEYLANEIEIRLKEDYVRNASRVYSSTEVYSNFVVQTHDFNLSQCLPQYPGYLWECTNCGDFVPTHPAVSLSCTCSNITINAELKQIQIADESCLRLVTLLGKGTGNKKLWWQFWKS